jgi:hypothetical protein
MAASDLREPADPPRERRGGRPRSRRLPVAGLLAGLAIGLAVVLLPSAGGPRPSAGTPAAGAGTGAGTGATLPPTAVAAPVPQAGTGMVPAALDAGFAAYSDHSTCADWAGGDGISGVRLSSSQVAWFFSDSYLGPATPSTGFANSRLVHNSVVIQTAGGDGSGFVTLTGGAACSPATVVSPPHAPGGPNTRYWVEDGLEVGQTVFKFYNSYRLGNAPYIPTGTVLAAFPASTLAAASTDGAVAEPQLTPLPSYTPPGNASPVAWGAAVLRDGGTVYVYGTQTPDTLVPDRQLYLARVPASQLTDFAAWQFYAGADRWTGSQPEARPVQPSSSSLSVSSGFSVVKAGQRYWLIQANPIAGNQDIDAYPATSPAGPFDQTAGIVLYRDPGIGLDPAHDFRLMYEARAELAVSTSTELVISYNVNSTGITTGCVPMSWFTNTVTQPRFVAVPLALLSGNGGPAGTAAAADTPAAGTAVAAGSRAAGTTVAADSPAAGTTVAADSPGDAVTAGPPDYPQVADRAPAQWFDEWNYRDGCPPVPGVTSAQARSEAGSVTLSWPDAGLGIGYHVYVRPPGAAGYTLRSTVRYVLSTTTRSVSVTLSGLEPGNYLAKVVPYNLRQTVGGAARVTFTVPS